MASRRDRHQARLAAVNALGKNLTRRASSGCELCAPEGYPGGLDLRVIEIEPTEEEPEEEAAILACSRCRELIDGGRLPDDPNALRFLEGAVWSDHDVVRVAAIRLLRRVARAEVPWASETLDGLWIPEELEARIQASPAGK